MLSFYFSWPLLQLGSIGAGFNFADLLSTLSTIDCYREIGFDVYSDSNAGYCGNYIYGRELLQIFSQFPIYPEHSESIGTIAILFFGIISGIFCITVIKQKTTSIFFAVFLIASPGTSLLLERGNIDVFMIIGVFIVGVLMSKNQNHLGILLLSILTIFKFYTLPLLAVLVLFKLSGRQRIFGIISLIATGLLSLRSISLIRAGFPEGGYSQFGLNIVGNYLRRGLEMDISHLQGRIFGYISFILLLLVMSYLIRKKSLASHLILKRKQIDSFGFYSILIFLTCYLTGLSYDYRLVFLIFGSLWILNSLNFERSFQVALQFLTAVACWCSTGIGAAIFPQYDFWQRYFVMGAQALGDLSTWILAGFFCIVIFESIKANLYLRHPQSGGQNNLI
jgi:hypothetical protein